MVFTFPNTPTWRDYCFCLDRFCIYGKKIVTGRKLKQPDREQKRDFICMYSIPFLPGIIQYSWYFQFNCRVCIVVALFVVLGHVPVNLDSFKVSS